MTLKQQHRFLSTAVSGSESDASVGEQGNAQIRSYCGCIWPAIEVVPVRRKSAEGMVLAKGCRLVQAWQFLASVISHGGFA